MSEAVEKVTSETAEKVVGKVFEWMNGLEGLVKEYGPEAVELGLWTIRIDGIVSLVYGLILFIVGAFLTYWAAYRFARWSLKEEEEEAMPLVLCAGIPSLGVLVVGAYQLFDVWSWAQVFMPEVYVARELTRSMLGI